MRKLLLLGALCMAAQSASSSASASAQDCQDVQDRLNAGDDSLTSAELLACGLSPEAISPCEGVPDPNCNNEGFPSIGGPNGVGETNECSGLPEGSPEAVACYEELIAGLGEGSASPSATASASADPCPDPDFPRETPDGCQASDLPDVEFGPDASPTASASASASASVEPVEALPETGGPSIASVMALPMLALLVAGGIFAARLVRR